MSPEAGEWEGAATPSGVQRALNLEATELPSRSAGSVLGVRPMWRCKTSGFPVAAV